MLRSARSLAKQLSSARGLLDLLRSLLSKGKRVVLGIVEFFKGGRRKARELFERITRGSEPHWGDDGATARAQARRRRPLRPRHQSRPRNQIQEPHQTVRSRRGLNR